MADRTLEDQLREEYFHLLPDIRRVSDQLEAEIRYHLLPLSSRLKPPEQLVFKSIVKNCESALEKLLYRKQEGAVVDRNKPELYSLRSLKDLAGVRVLAFPRSRITEIDATLKECYPSWKEDPIEDALKYSGYCREGDRVRGEYQIVSLLTGLFWEVEHSAMYKPDPRFKAFAESLQMRQRSADVIQALRAFEEEFEKMVRDDVR